MKIAFLGDSITLGYGLEDPENRYSTLVSRALGMTELNYGITGTLVARAGLNREDQKDFISRAYLIDDADIALVFGGTNDYFWSDEPIYGETEQYFEGAINALIARVKEKRSGKITLFVTPYPHNGVGNFENGGHWKDSDRHDTSAKNYNGHSLADYAAVIKTLCDQDHMPCLDLFEDFGFDWRTHTIDGCHPNEAGHRLLARVITEKLKTMIPAEK